eukprot:8420705-Alexandrium_andersonii.AAC.1
MEERTPTHQQHTPRDVAATHCYEVLACTRGASRVPPCGAHCDTEDPKRAREREECAARATRM